MVILECKFASSDRSDDDKEPKPPVPIKMNSQPKCLQTSAQPCCMCCGESLSAAVLHIFQLKSDPGLYGVISQLNRSVVIRNNSSRARQCNGQG